MRPAVALTLCLSATALACCTGEKREEAVQTPADEPAFPAADGGPATGKFEISSADGGAVMVQEVLPDGTYRNLRDGKLLETGTWTMPDRGLFCTTSNGAMSCDEESIAPDGTWISVNVEDAAVRWIIRRLEESSEPPAG